MRLLLLIILLLAGCATTQAPPDVRVVRECSWISPLTFSTQDTPETKREIIALSDKIKANCPSHT